MREREREAAPRLTFRGRDNGVKINSQAPVVALASLASQFLSLPHFGDRKVPFRSGHSSPLSRSCTRRRRKCRRLVNVCPRLLA